MALSNQVAVGQSRHADATTAARAAARQARAQLSWDQKPAWVLAFAGGLQDPSDLLAGFQAELGPLPVIGGSAVGIISPEGASTSGYECGILLFAEALAPRSIVTVDTMETDEGEAGRRLGETLRALDLTPERVVLLFYDSIKSGPPPVLHIGSRLLDGLHQGLGDCHPMIVGAGTLSNLSLSDSYLFDGQGIRRHGAVAAVLPASLIGHTTIMHGCLPASDFLEITRIDGSRVLELDHRPALQVVEERLRVTRDELLARHPLPFLTLGEKLGNPYAPFNDNQYVNRLVVAIDPVEESLILFESDFNAGSRVQIMGYEPDRMIESCQDQTQSILANLNRNRLAFGLYIDCAGRSMAFIGLDQDESTPVREQVAPLCPFLGCYTGVEIAPFHGRARPLDWTGVLLLCTSRD
ncbi:FIST signal transduction protein [Thiorhodovibrio frisius]|uniref:FIST domain-containing protein n=1 Tax=Thiorhodovibrio frisius TaxID=631362 RepID=H8YWW1_9GAMM|nr:FIST N-terminal domain-containing protein [Thiorhodovibrio frisius]EIC22937.1 hypothetical protein Thi970DRAFT_00577 [Thiorhodovibrio frisius]WPL22804.1 hypothetical protein Thiofri_02978 [Thiorhodovibrio frisius]